MPSKNRRRRRCVTQRDAVAMGHGQYTDRGKYRAGRQSLESRFWWLRRPGGEE